MKSGYGAAVGRGARQRQNENGMLCGIPFFLSTVADYLFSVRVMRFSLMRAFLPVRSRR